MEFLFAKTEVYIDTNTHSFQSTWSLIALATIYGQSCRNYNSKENLSVTHT